VTEAEKLLIFEFKSGFLGYRYLVSEEKGRDRKRFGGYYVVFLSV